MTAPTVYHLRDAAGIEVFTGTITPAPGGGSQPGAVRMVGPYVVTFEDIAVGSSEGDTNGYGLIGEVADGDAVVGVAWRVTEAFNDGGSGIGAASVGPADPETAAFDTVVRKVPLNSTGADGIGTFGSLDLGSDAIYTTAAGANPKNASLTSHVQALPWFSPGASVYLVVDSWAGDGNAGSIGLYLFVATPDAP